MTNILGDDKQQQVLALGRLGWPLRRIQAATGVRRETASAYLKAAGIAVRLPRRRRPPAPTPASEVSTDFGGPPAALASLPAWPPPTSRAPTVSACEPYRELIEPALARGRNAMAIWQDLVDDHGFRGRYASVRRFLVTLRGQRTLEAHPVIVTAPGEGQVDYGEGPMVRHPLTRKYRRTRLFVFTSRSSLVGPPHPAVQVLVFSLGIGSGLGEWLRQLGVRQLQRRVRRLAFGPRTVLAGSGRRHHGLAERRLAARCPGRRCTLGRVDQSTSRLCPRRNHLRLDRSSHNHFWRLPRGGALA